MVTNKRIPPREFWSGVITFGRVSLPVSLLPINRGNPVFLSMVNDQGDLLVRRYLYASDNLVLDRDNEGCDHPITKDSLILVEGQNLGTVFFGEARAIDLRRFAPINEIDSDFFDQCYFLEPDSRSRKAYRLLAKIMAEEKRAGIATFVMEEKEHLIAITAERGLLRVETMRFHDGTQGRIWPSQPPLPTQNPMEK